MAGTVVGSVDHKVGNTGVGTNNNQELFVVLYNFLNSKYTRIASNFGTGGTGFGFHDVANPAGDNAFAVFRAASAANPFNVMIQWSDAGTWVKMKLNNSTVLDGVGIVAAMREDGTNPFNGGPVLLGTDVNATVNTSVNNALRIRPNQVDAYTVIAVTAGAATPKTTIRDDLNTAFTSGSLPFVAAVEGTNQLKVYALNLADVDVDSVANGSILNTPVGFPVGGTVVDPNLGADEVPPNGVKPAWSAGSSVLHMLDYANGDNGSHGNGAISTDRNNMYQIGDDLANPTYFCRVHLIGDDDGLFIGCTSNSNDVYYSGSYVGAYAPRTGSTPAFPLCSVYDRNFTGVWNVAFGTYGSSTGASVEEGGIVGNVEADDARQLYVENVTGAWMAPTYQPNPQSDTVGEFDAMPFALVQLNQRAGLVGFVPTALVNWVNSVPNNSRSGSSSPDLAFIGASGSTNCFQIPWHAAAGPVAVGTRDGVQF